MDNINKVSKLEFYKVKKTKDFLNLMLKNSNLPNSKRNEILKGIKLCDDFISRYNKGER